MDELRTTASVDDGADGRTGSPPPAPAGVHIPQLTRRGVLGVWAAAAVPMGLLAWVVTPLVADRLEGPGALARALIACLTVGLVWQFVLVVALVRREQGTLRWSVVREALWLRAPRDPRSGRRGGRVWLVLPLLVVAFFAATLVPSLPAFGGRDFGVFLMSDAGSAVLGGAWGWFAVLVVLWVCNTVLGEELLFRGYLLPRMNGVFGNRDWIANGILFGLYHLHRWWAIPGLLLGTLTYAWPAKHYRSALVSIAVHSAQSLVLVVLVLPLVMA
jgi:uncharacterized protein